jgi:hypothetical protein
LDEKGLANNIDTYIIPLHTPPIPRRAQLLLRTILAACAVYACWLPAGHPVFYTAAIRLSLAGLSSPAIFQVRITPYHRSDIVFSPSTHFCSMWQVTRLMLKHFGE